MTQATKSWSPRDGHGHLFLANVSPAISVRKKQFEFVQTENEEDCFIGGIFVDETIGIIIIRKKVDGVMKTFIPFRKRVSNPEWLMRYQNRRGLGPRAS